MSSLYEPLTTEMDLLVQQQAEAVGLRMRKLNSNLYVVSGTWCPVIITWSSYCSKWRVSREGYANRHKRWRTIYYGPRLETALAKAKRYEETD